MLNGMSLSLQSIPIGWDTNADRLRGHIFANDDNSTVVISIKGTSAGLLGSGGPTAKNVRRAFSLQMHMYTEQGEQKLTSNASRPGLSSFKDRFNDNLLLLVLSPASSRFRTVTTLGILYLPFSVYFYM